MSKSEGILKLSFKSEEAAKNFASNWQECNGNFLIDAEITEVSSLDELTYNVKLNADCVASLVDDEFYYAYQKGIKKSEIVVSSSLYFESQRGDIQNQVESLKSLLVKDYEDLKVELMSWESPDAYTSPILSLATGSQNICLQTSSTCIPNGYGAAVNSTLTYGKVSRDMVLAIAYCMLYAEAAAKGQLRNEGVDITKADIYRSRRYYDLLISNLTGLGLTVRGAGGGEVKVTRGNNTTLIADMLQDVVGTYLNAEMMSLFLDKQRLFMEGSCDAAINDFLTFWWNSSNFQQSESSYSSSPIVLVNGNPETTMVFYTYNYKASHWRSLFVEKASFDFYVYSNAITLNLNMAHYYSVIYPAIFPLIRDAIPDKIKDTPLVFEE